MDIKNDLIAVFAELRSASMKSENPKSLGIKYDLAFMGENHNLISTRELHTILSESFNINIDINEFQELVPSICEALSMKYEASRKLNDISNPVPCDYFVQLW